MRRALHLQLVHPLPPHLPVDGQHVADLLVTVVAPLHHPHREKYAHQAGGVEPKPWSKSFKVYSRHFVLPGTASIRSGLCSIVFTGHLGFILYWSLGFNFTRSLGFYFSGHFGFIVMVNWVLFYWSLVFLLVTCCHFH